MASSQLGSTETGADVKIFFQGKFEANPNTANHSNAINKGTLTVYKRENGKLIKEFSDDEFRKWQEQNFEARGWNLYGSHGFDILETTVTGAEIDYHKISDDKLLGKSVKLLGHELDGELTTPKMVDQGLHIITSQIFADKFVLGDEANNITLSNLSVGYFRTYNPKQILNVHPEFQDESGSGRFYFRCKPQDVAIKGSSSLVTSFQESVKNKASIVIWFSLFNTVHGPKGTAFNTPTPAYGTLQGYITTMNHPFKLEDRFLVPENSSLIPNCEGGTASICIDKAKKIITLDLMNAIPFAGRNDSQLQMKRSQILADNKEHGMNGKTKIESSDVPMLADRKSWSLSLKFLADDGKCTDLGPISISDNNCIINVQYKEDLDLPTGCFLITDNENKPVFKERDTNCYLEKPFMYMEHYDMDLSPDPCETKIHVFRRGVPTADHKMYMYPFIDLKQYPDNEFSSTEKSTWNELSPIMLKFATYDESYPEGSVGWIKTDDNGTATISVIGSGNLIVTLRDRRYNKNKKHIAHTEYITDNWFSVRVLPYDKQLLKAPKEQRTTWDFVYSNIFRYYHLVHPFISEKVLALNSESTVKQNASTLTKRTSKENVNKSWFVPAARYEGFAVFAHLQRNTSDVKRTILHEFLTSSKGFPTDT